ncbi:MAG TPA: glycosyltransferase [Anaeromyxobacteraceae bacterium]|nr:glycosyltransferase [Anaeromyxobacteraceae bacterium]
MQSYLSLALFSVASLGLCTLALGGVLLRRHLASAPPAPRRTPPISVLKPLCGIDDRLEENLALFAGLDYPDYEVVLGLKSARDPAWRVACAAARRWPDRFRVVLQRGAPGLNPKVNQLVTLARAARHGLLVVSDSNVRVEKGYLSEIAALLEDETVGLVTHLIAGVGEQRAGSLMDHLHLVGSVAPGIAALKRLALGDVVVGKSMALRRADLSRMGGFEAVKDVLAEDYVIGLMVSSVLHKRVEVARRPVQNVSEQRTVGEFAARYRRWGVMQRQAVGPAVYLAMALLNPVPLAAVGALVRHTPGALFGFAATCAAKAALDGAAARALRPGGFAVRQLLWVPLKDLVFSSAWAYGLVHREVEWRGHRLRVVGGTRLELPASDRALPEARRAVSAS